MSPEPAAPEPDRDDPLAAAFATDAVPPTPPGLPTRVRHRLRRRLLTRRLAVPLAAVLGLAAGALAWRLRPGPASEVARGPAPAETDLSEAALPRVAAPVAPLDVLARQQAAYQTVLEEMAKEF